MELALAIGIFLLIAGVVGIIYAVRYNKIIVNQLKTNEAEVNIDEQLRNKYDDVIRCINIIERKAKLDIKAFDDVKKVKSDKVSNFELDRLLSKAYDEILVISEDYSKVKEVKSFDELVKDIENIEEHLVALRSYYNKYCFDFNKRIKTFPDTMLAKFHGFKEKSYYDGKNLNDEIYTDFKL